MDTNVSPDGSTVIPEMQKIKDKYPQYKDTPDFELLQAISKKYPVYQKPLEEVESGLLKKDRLDVSHESFKNNIISGSNELLPDALVGLGNVPLGRVLRHGWGAVQAAVAGQSPVEGFKNPDQQQPFGVSYAKAEDLDLNKTLDFTLATIADVSANILTGHLLYGAPVKAAVETYNKAQNSAMSSLHETITNEFKKAGAKTGEASNLATHITNKINTQGFIKNNPVALGMLRRKIDGKLGSAISDHLNAAKTNASSQGTPDIFKRIGTQMNQGKLPYKTIITPPPETKIGIGVSSKVEPTKVIPNDGSIINQPSDGSIRTTKPSTDFGNQIQTQLQKKYDIPLHPASEGRIAVSKLLRNQPPTAEKQPTQPNTTERGTQTTFLKNQNTTTQPLPQYKDTPEINKKYIEHEKTAPSKVVPIKSVKLTKKLTDSAAKLGAKDVKNIPIMVNNKMEVIDGNHRLTDAINNGDKTIKITVQPELYSNRDVQKSIYEPGTGANPTSRYSAQVRHRGWAVAEKFFDSHEEASKWLDNLPLDISKIEMTKGVTRSYGESIISKKGFGVIDVTPKIAKLSIPAIKPDEVIKSPDIADEALQRQGNQSPDTLKISKSIKTIPTAEISKVTEKPSARQTLQRQRIQDIKDRAEKYHPNTFWDVSFVDDYGSHNTMVDGPGLKTLENNAKIVSKSKLTSNKGELYIPLEEMGNILTNIKGEAEKIDNSFRYTIKTLGNSFFIGEKYPPFKKVLDAIQNPIDESNEHFYNGTEMLDRKSGEKLDPHLQERVNQALNYGDSQSVQKYFTDQELKDKFSLTDPEIKAYQGFVKMYKHGLDIALKTRKLEIDFDKLDPKDQQYAETNLKNQMDKIGGYISHTRLGGDWALYQPGDSESEPPKFFDLFKDKSSAEKMSKSLEGSKVYLKTNVPREDFGKLSIHDLQSLAEAQDIDTVNSPDYAALKEELMKRSNSKNWIRRNWIPRSTQTLTDKYDNAIDYLNAQTSRYARVKGRNDGQKAFNDNAKMMSPSLAKHAKNVMDLYFSGKSQDSNKVFQSLNKIVYAYRLMFKTSFFLQHLTHPLSVTYPELAKGLNGLDAEKLFMNAYSMSRRFALNKITGSAHGLSKDTMDMMEKLHKQGYLGDQLNKFQLDSRTRVRTGFEHFLGSMARVSEGTNRVHSAMSGMLKADQLGIKDPLMREDYVKNFMKKTVFLYGKLYTPTLVTGAGSMKSLMNTMYRFRSFEVNYLHALASNFRAGPSSYIRSIGGMTAMAGIKGAPFFALLAMAYAWKTGHTLDNDTREAAQEAHIPDKAIDMTLHGIPSLAGADLSSLIGTADIISPYGDPLSKIGGASVGFSEQIMEGIYYLNIGDRERALEKLSPDFIARILRAKRYSQEGIRKENGDTILANPSKFDTILSSTGIEPLQFTKAYDARDAKDAIATGQEKRDAQYNTILGKALHEKDISKYKDILEKIDNFNKTAKDEDKIRISNSGINNAYKRMLDGKKYPKQMDMIIKNINQRYGLQ